MEKAVKPWRWTCTKCTAIIEVEAGKRPPLEELHAKGGVRLTGTDWMDISKVCAAEEFRKMPELK